MIRLLPSVFVTAGSALCALLSLATGLTVVSSSPAIAQSNSCEYRYDGECDESFGTGICADGTDSWDCRRVGPPPTAESCIYSNDGECDEPGGTGVCIPFTDTNDCRRERIDPARVFFGLDDRIYPDSTQMPWRAIGRITFTSGGHCTGSLVGPSTVLTAAHCLFGGEGPDGRDKPLEFIAGASGPYYVERAAIIGTYVPDQFDNWAHQNTSDVDGYDWAFLSLDRPIGNTVGWLSIEPLSSGELETAVLQHRMFVMQAGYSGDSLSFLSANLRCPVVDVWPDNTIFHECDTLQGDSGSPLFVSDGSSYRIIALESATYPNDEGPYDFNMAVDARAFWATGSQFMN